MTYLDNDEAGEWAYEQLEKALPAWSLVRGNALYEGAKDLDEYLVGLKDRV